MMDPSTAARPAEDYSLSGAGVLRDDEQELADAIRVNIWELFEKLRQLGDLYGDTLQGSHARSAAAAAQRASVLANRLP